MIKITSLGQVLRTAPWRLSLLHASDRIRVIRITHGQGRMMLGSRLRGFGVHNFACIPAGAPFALEAAATTNGHVISLPADHGATWPAEPLHLRVRDSGAQTEIAALVEALQREHSGARPGSDDAMDAYARLVAVWLHRQIESRPDAVPDKPSAGDRLAAAFLSELEAHFSKGLSMAEYAERIGVTPTHLARVCKAQFGRSAAQLISERGLHEARKLLETGRFTAKSISESLGFGSPAYFSRFILAQTGKTPSDLRRAGKLRVERTGTADWPA